MADSKRGDVTRMFPLHWKGSYQNSLHTLTRTFILFTNTTSSRQVLLGSRLPTSAYRLVCIQVVHDGIFAYLPAQWGSGCRELFRRGVRMVNWGCETGWSNNIADKMAKITASWRAGCARSTTCKCSSQNSPVIGCMFLFISANVLKYYFIISRLTNIFLQIWRRRIPPPHRVSFWRGFFFKGSKV